MFGDIVFARLGLLIEVDGYEAHSSGAAFESDRARQNALVTAGWTVLRFTYAMITRNPEQVLADIQHAITLTSART